MKEYFTSELCIAHENFLNKFPLKKLGTISYEESKFILEKYYSIKTTIDYMGGGIQTKKYFEMKLKLNEQREAARMSLEDKLYKIQNNLDISNSEENNRYELNTNDSKDYKFKELSKPSSNKFHLKKQINNLFKLSYIHSHLDLSSKLFQETVSDLRANLVDELRETNNEILVGTTFEEDKIVNTYRKINTNMKSYFNIGLAVLVIEATLHPISNLIAYLN